MVPDDAARVSLPADLERLLHDLRGPLNSAVIHLEVVKRAGVDDPLAKQSLETLGQELARLARMLPAAFAVAALDRDESAALDLRALVERALAEHGFGGVTLTDAPWPAVRGDAALLTVAVTHLVRNAIEATEAAGRDRPRPRISAESSAQHVALVVRDWGAGLRNPRVAIRLAGSQKPGRTGIGLVTVERVARLHGGTLALSTPPDGGVEARLTLPSA